MFVNYISLEPIKNNSIIKDNNFIHLPFLIITHSSNNIVKIQINQIFHVYIIKVKLTIKMFITRQCD